MPSAPKRPCPRCGRLVLGGGRCPRCPRPSAPERGYAPEWAPAARAWLARFPYCGQRQDGRLCPDQSRCARLGLRVPARVVDHIRSLASGGALLDPANLQSLCYSCNNRKR
jgi:5-methylcytosine-specific restriction endonuclease McrA